jgi:hypothetical protein
MNALFPRRWFGLATIGFAALTGCSHCHRHCDCVTSVQPIRQVVVAPTPPPPPPVVETAVPAVTTLPEPTTETKKVEPAQGAVFANAVAPSGDNNNNVTGTLIFTPAEAEALGIVPGMTPGALFVPKPAPTSEANNH